MQQQASQHTSDSTMQIIAEIAQCGRLLTLTP